MIFSGVYRPVERNGLNQLNQVTGSFENERVLRQMVLFQLYHFTLFIYLFIYLFIFFFFFPILKTATTIK